MDENYDDYQEEYINEDEIIENDGELPPDAKEYYEYRNQIDIMEKEKKLLQTTLKEAKQKYKSNQSMKRSKQKLPFQKHDDYTNYKEYEKQILSNMMDDQLFEGIGTRQDILGEFVDKVLDRSLYVYRNRNCHTCAKLLSMGKSTQKCPKCHHLLKELNEQRKKNKKNSH